MIYYFKNMLFYAIISAIGQNGMDENNKKSYHPYKISKSNKNDMFSRFYELL